MRRAEHLKGDAKLVFQEGKKIDDGYFVIGVFDHPTKCQVHFTAYELETDHVHALTFQYREFDELFKFNSELMNPNNKDNRYSYVIQRLDFVLLANGQKHLILSDEKTTTDVRILDSMKPEAANIGGGDAELAAEILKGKIGTQSSIDPEKRNALLAELRSGEADVVLQTLVQSENARKRFLTEVHAKQVLTSMKAAQRLNKMDEERALRHKKLQEQQRRKFEKALYYQNERQNQSVAVNNLHKAQKQRHLQATQQIIEEQAINKRLREDNLAIRAEERKSRDDLLRQQKEAYQNHLKRQNTLRKRAEAANDDARRILNHEEVKQKNDYADTQNQILTDKIRRRENQRVEMLEVQQANRVASAEKIRYNEQLEHSRAIKDEQKVLHRNQEAVKSVLAIHRRHEEKLEYEKVRLAEALEAEAQAAELRYAEARALKEELDIRDKKREESIIEYRRVQKLRNESKAMVSEHMQNNAGKTSQEIPQPNPDQLKGTETEIVHKVEQDIRTMRRTDRTQKNDLEVKQAALRMSSNRQYLSQLEVNKVKEHKEIIRAQELKMESAIEKKRQQKANEMLAHLEATQSRVDAFGKMEPLRQQHIQNKAKDSNESYIETQVRKLAEDNCLTRFLPDLSI